MPAAAQPAAPTQNPQPAPREQPAQVDPASVPAPPGSGVILADPSPPAPGPSLAAFTTLAGWLAKAEVGDDPAEGFPAVPIAAVTLRHDHAVMATGLAIADDRLPPGGVVRAAYEAAWERAKGFLPRRGDALDDARRDDFLALVTLELELAGPLVPIADADLFTLESDPLRRPRPVLNVGIEGLAAKAGRYAAAVTPGRMLRERLEPVTAYAEAVERAMGEPGAVLKPPAELRARGLALYRFRTTHIAQFAPGAPGRFLERGGRVVQLTDVGTEAAIAALATGIGDHLLSRAWPGVRTTMSNRSASAGTGASNSPTASTASGGCARCRCRGTPRSVRTWPVPAISTEPSSGRLTSRRSMTNGRMLALASTHSRYCR